MAGKTGRTKSNLKPLSGSVYYLDLRPSRRRDLLKLDLLKLGAQLEEFLSKDVKYLVTDRLDGTTSNATPHTGNNEYNSKVHLDADPWLPETPVSGVPSPTFTRIFPLDNDIQFPDSPVTDSQRTPVPIHTTVQSRGQALLERAVKHKLQKQGSADVLEVSRQFGIKILPLRTFLQSIQHLLEPYKQKPASVKASPCNKKSNDKSYKLETLGESFIKVQDMKEEHRPFYRQLVNYKLFWEQLVNASGDQEKKMMKENKLRSPKTPSAPSQREGSSIGLAAKVRDMYKVSKAEKQPVQRLSQPKLKTGYCEICSMSFSNLAKHLLSKTHSAYMSKEANFEHLKGMVQILPSIGSLRKKRKKRPPTELKQGVEDSQLKKRPKSPSHPPPATPQAKLPKVSDSSSSFLDIKVCTAKVRGCAPAERLFTDSEDDDEAVVEASCSTAGPGGILYRFSSEEIPLLVSNTGKVVIPICSSPNCPHRPPEAHRSSSSTVPFIPPGVFPLNLSLRRSSDGKLKDKSSDDAPSKTVIRQSDHVFFSENARVSSLGLKETPVATVASKKDCHPDKGDLSFSHLNFVGCNCVDNEATVDATVAMKKGYTNDLSFSNVNFVACNSVDEGFETASKSKLKPVVVRKDGMSPMILELTASSGEDDSSRVESNPPDVLSVRKALFMSEESSPLKTAKLKFQLKEEKFSEDVVGELGQEVGAQLVKSECL